MFRWSLMPLILLACADVCQADPTVGVYYYPWWGESQGGHTLDQTVRAHTTPNHQLPAVGDEYSSRDAGVISAHIDQSHLGNISMWSMSWWGPNSFEDRTIRNHILPHPRADELSYTIHYESSGRLGSHSNPNYNNLIPDFLHLGNNVFNDPNYMRIDDRPVVVMYLSRVFFKDAAGATALSNLRTTMQNQFGYDPYIIGDHLFGSVADGAANLDAITGFDVYGQVFRSGEATQRKIDQLERIYSNAQAAADSAGVDFVPGLTPGYNDKAVRAGNLPAPRYLTGEDFGTTMEAMLEDAVLPHTDVDINDLILVNSFNEWHEDTQIEASVIGPSTNTDDSPSGMDLTVGRFYEGYGNKYLDILRNATQTTPPITPSEIRWGRGTADGNFVGNYTDVANWNANDVLPDAQRAPSVSDRARVDRSGTDMTIDSVITANDFLFGVDEAGQTFSFEASADVTLASNLFASFNSGDIDFDVKAGASLSIGGNFLLGQHDGNQSGQQMMNDEDITVTIEGIVDSAGDVILGDRYGLVSATTSSDVDVLLDITTGVLRANDIKFAPNGDLATYLNPALNNSMGVRIGDEGMIVIVGSDSTAKMNSLIADGLLFTDSLLGTLAVSYGGIDTIVEVVLGGDFDRDGDVDGADYLVWQRDPGVGDLTDWQKNYGIQSGAPVSVVPEPASLVLALAGTVALVSIARGHR